MSLSQTYILPEGILGQESYSVAVHCGGRWVTAAETASLSDAERAAETMHRRSNLPVEIRDELGTLLIAYEPPCAEPGVWDS